MAKAPGFIFYPGDYLRDTQCLSEAVQVAYDRIMCEHMRNICISQQQLTFFTKRLNPDQREELLNVLTQVDGGYQITWVADSILKYNAFRESRSKNRQGKTKEHKNITSNSSDKHMDIENDNEDTVLKKDIVGVEEFPRAFPFDTTLPPWTLEACELNQHAITKDKNTEWILQQWDIFILERANDPPAERSMYRQITDLTKYFLNWIRTKTPQKNGAIKTGFGKDNQQLGTSDARIQALRTWGT